MRKNPRSYPVFFIFPFLLLFVCTPGLPAPGGGSGKEPGSSRGTRLTLVSRSAGLNVPDKEEGRTEFEVADMNGDGHLDIVSVGDHGSPNVNSGEHGIMVWLGDGAGTWAVHQSGNFGYGGCAAADLDGDGHLDLAFGVHHDWGSGGFGDRLIGAALGDGSGAHWTPWGNGLATGGETYGMFATALADFDCDGKLDILCQSFGGSNGLHLYKNLGQGNWSHAWSLPGGSVAYTLEAADIDADGFPDIVSTRSGTNILLGDGAFGFSTCMSGLPSGTIRGIHTGDMDNDGDGDLVFALGSTGIRCYRFRKGTKDFESASNGLPRTGTFDLTQFGDIDGDGFLDIAAFSAPTGYVFLGNGAGDWTFAASWTMPSPGDASALRVDGDVDHDGREDIVVSATKSGFPFHRNQLRVYSPWIEPSALSAVAASPRGGETFRTGSSRDIRWLAAVPPSQGQATVTIRLSENGPAGPWKTIAAGIPDNGRFQWFVEGFATEHARIGITVATATESVSAVSPRDFTIIGPPPSLDVDTHTLSAASGGRVNFSLAAGAAHKNRLYLLAGSLSGTEPGTLLPGGLATIPLNRDGFTDFILARLNSPVFSGFFGTLDAAGGGSARLDAPPVPGLAGRTMAFAFATAFPFDFASNAVAIVVVP